ncbi:GDP-mannose 4,6-dehydratase [Candidatus Bathyarchaeota archaeon]|nr:GDP-mannose 4,6-dehydratase [Candidatus Bathyarchaeota archaeon]
MLATPDLLEALKNTGNIKTVIFTSSSTVYSGTSTIPTPENSAPLEPISIYSASKLHPKAKEKLY